MSNAEYPYSLLGRELKAARIRQKKTLAEASGAVELTEDVLASFEKGSQRPAEDTLMVLISYFGFKENEADKLWNLAGYRNVEEDMSEFPPQISVTLPGDLRIVYTDMVHVMVNDFGVVMNFMQNAGNSGQPPLAISRIGMSKDHARSVIEVLQRSLEQAEQGNKPNQTKLLNSEKTSEKTELKSKPSSKTSTNKPSSEVN